MIHRKLTLEISHILDSEKWLLFLGVIVFYIMLCFLKIRVLIFERHIPKYLR